VGFFAVLPPLAHFLFLAHISRDAANEGFSPTSRVNPLAAEHETDPTLKSPICSVRIQTKEIPMSRLRKGALAVAAGLGFLSGCSSLCNHPLLSRFRSTPEAACCEADCCEGPMLEGAGPSCGPACQAPLAPAPLAPAPIVSPNALPPNAVPQLSQPPRLVPQPQLQSQPIPYAPQ
jgi:hypothetical protein